MVVVMVVGWALGGCASKAKQTTATGRVTDVDPKLAERDYWLAQPATAKVSGRFEQLWDASENAAREFLFKIARRDQRSGLLTTEPMISKQMFEVWRKDAGTMKDTAENSLQNIRRTIVFQFQREGDGVYSVTPKVVVEKESRVDERYRTDSQLPASYWYALRRDEVMEKRVAREIQQNLKD
jgi:hypothetical protein